MVNVKESKSLVKLIWTFSHQNKDILNHDHRKNGI